jgi:hypothetical protein
MTLHPIPLESFLLHELMLKKVFIYTPLKRTENFPVNIVEQNRLYTFGICLVESCAVHRWRQEGVTELQLKILVLHLVLEIDSYLYFSLFPGKETRLDQRRMLPRSVTETGTF